MKTFKQREHSVFPRPFGMRGAMRLAVGVMVYFDLTDSNVLYSDQDMWKEVPDQLGPVPVLDQGVPKPRGEAVVAGSCFAPRGTSRPASKVRVRVGEVDKSINVYGNRYWQGGVITEAEPFAEMPVVWANAFGGEDFKRNPKGKGIAKVALPEGSEAVPLPNLELAGQQIGSPGDRPDPACFDQLAMDNPVRFDKCGTYDDKWKEERWPYYPDDMNYEFFNVASEDQFIEGFFQGGEPITVENMHPDMPVIESSLPNLRMRTFVTVNPEFKLHTFPTGPLPSHQLRDTDEFREISMHMDTVWLFPTILRGVAVYRGTTEISDEEYGDVPRILVRHEDPAEPPKSVEHYRDLQIQLLNRGVEIDMAPLEAAAAKGQEAMVDAKKVAKMVNAVKQKALGKAPQMPMPSPQEMQGMADKQLASHNALIDKLETMTKSMHAKHGHQVEIDLTVFDRMRGNLKETGAKVEQAVDTLSKTQAKLEGNRIKAVEKAKEKLKAAKLRIPSKVDVDIPDDALAALEKSPLERSVNPWHDAGFPVVVAARKRVDDSAAARKAFKRLGLKSKTVRESWMGRLDEPVDVIPSEWGLDDDAPFTIPAGLVLPRFDGPVLNRISVVPDPLVPGESVLVPGADETPLFIHSATLIDLPTMPAADGAPVVIVGDELQAHFVEQAAGDCVSVLAMAAPDETPGDEAAEALENAQIVLAVMPEKWKDDRELTAIWAKWAAAFDGVVPLELEHGATVFASRDEGSDIRSWIFERLPNQYAAAHSVEIALPEPGKPPSPDFMKGFKPPLPADLKGMVLGVIDQVRAEMEKKFEPLKAKQAKLIDQANERLGKLDIKNTKLDIPKLTMDLKGGPKTSPQQMADKSVANLEKVKAKLRAKKALTPEVEGRIDESIGKFKKLGAESQALSDKLNAEFKVKKAELNAEMEKLDNREPPDQAKEAFAKYGIDPDKIRPLTREQAKRLHDGGSSLAGYILSNVDLSELDFTGADFTGCQIAGTNFAGAILDEATFVQCIGKETNFTGASLKGANLERSVFPKALFVKADMSGVRMRQAVIKEADMTDATLKGVNLDMAVMDKITGVGADFSEASVYMAVLSGDLTGADFRKAQVEKCLVKKGVVDKADFRGAKLGNTLFNSVTGEGVTFAGGNLDRFRSGNNTQLRGADFTGASMADATLRDSDLSGAKMTGVNLDRAIVEDVQLVEADLNRAVGRGVRFHKSNLEGATARGANFFTSSMRKARLVNADLRGSNFYATNFYKSVIGNTDFDGSELDKSLLHKRLELLDDDE